MTPEQFVAQALLVPHVPGEGSWAGADCWGMVELYYQHVLGVQLIDRQQIQPGNDGLKTGFDAAQRWQQVEHPDTGCLVIMRAGKLNEGHVGIFVSGGVLHSTMATGCVFQQLTDRYIRAKVTTFLRYA